MIAFTLALIMAVTACAYSNETAQSSISDSVAYQQLLALGIIEEGEAFSGGVTISRSDFVKLIVRLGGGDSWLVAENQQVFADVSLEYKNAAYIHAAYHLGYINGEANGNFNPDRPITVTEAAYLLVQLLNYTVLAEQKGGYPTGYLLKAHELGILRNTSNQLSDGLAVTEALDMVMIAAQASPLSLKSSGSAFSYTVDKTSTLLAERHDIYTARGIVDANHYTDLFAVKSELRRGFVSIDGKAYAVGDTNADGFLGYNAEVFYRQTEDGDYHEILHICEAKGRNTTLILNSKDIGEADGFTYAVEGQQNRTIRLSDTVKLIYNGKTTGFSPEKLKPEIGEVTFIDNNSDSFYDVVKVMSYETYMVSDVSVSTGFVSTVQDTRLFLGDNDNDYDILIMKDGKKANIKEVARDDILLYAESDGEGLNLKTVLASTRKHIGVITELSEMDITIDNRRYEASPQVLETVAVGMSGTFYIDALGRIAAIKGESKDVYGYLNQIRVDDGIGNKVHCRIFTENKNWVTLTMRDRLSFDGRSVRATEVANELGSEPGDYRQLITYRVNQQSEITTFNTAKAYDMFSEEEAQAMSNGSFRLSAGLFSRNYRTSLKSFEADFSVNDGTLFFIVPNQTDGVNEGGFSIVIGTSRLIGDTPYTVAAYDAGETHVAPVCVLYNPVSQNINSNSNIQSFMIVSGMAQSLDKNGNARNVLKVFSGGAKISLYLNDEDILDAIEGGLQKGDIIQALLNLEGEATSVSRLYSAAQGSRQTGIINAVYSAYTFVAAEVKAFDERRQQLVLRYDDGTYGVFGTTSGLRGVYLYDRERDILTVSSVSEITVGDYIYASFRYLQGREIIIFRDNET